MRRPMVLRSVSCAVAVHDTCPNRKDSFTRNLNSSDSARLHRTISLMYVGARHLEFGITFHKVT